MKSTKISDKNGFSVETNWMLNEVIDTYNEYSDKNHVLIKKTNYSKN